MLKPRGLKKTLNWFNIKFGFFNLYPIFFENASGIDFHACAVRSGNNKFVEFIAFYLNHSGRGATNLSGTNLNIGVYDNDLKGGGQDARSNQTAVCCNEGASSESPVFSSHCF